VSRYVPKPAPSTPKTFAERFDSRKNATATPRYGTMSDGLFVPVRNGTVTNPAVTIPVTMFARCTGARHR
jgi:hypothetical protein